MKHALGRGISLDVQLAAERRLELSVVLERLVAAPQRGMQPHQGHPGLLVGGLGGHELLERPNTRQRKTRGGLREAGGTLKENVGALTGDEVTEAEGHAQRVRGQAERKG